jgi:FkbM family methyltransferase
VRACRGLLGLHLNLEICGILKHKERFDLLVRAAWLVESLLQETFYHWDSGRPTASMTTSVVSQWANLWGIRVARLEMFKSFCSQDFTIRHRLTSAVSGWFQGVVYTSNGGLTKGLRRKGGLGFLPEIAHPETAETRFLRTIEFTGKTVFDIGGFQGIMTLFFAKTARHVVTFEPIPSNVVRIYENADLNKFVNIFVLNIAVGNHDGTLRLLTNPEMMGGASGDPEISSQIRGNIRDATEFSVILSSIDAVLQRFELSEPDFIKIDIEGMELDALQGMRRLISTKKPDLYLELHGTTMEDKLANATDVIQFIRNCGYGIFDVERNRDITGEVPTGHESHIFCSHLKATR